jgi:MinD-like ATPase involved in chromosome partitioning or flagellar assembly
MKSHGKIITFYSYKGGVGRSMSLANIAWLLASHGNRVLAIDWDLEAPGLPRYFHPFLDARVLASSPGLIDLFSDHVANASVSHGLPSIRSSVVRQEEMDISSYIVPLQWSFPGDGKLDLLPAGKHGPAYARLVSEFDWSKLYEEFDGFELLQNLRNQIRSAYDYVLIDSRTGLSDTAGICTITLPDILVMCFSLNRQSIDGSVAVAEAVDAQRRPYEDRVPLRIFPVPMRVELSEYQKLVSARQHIASKFSRFLNHLPEDEMGRYWSAVEIGSFPFYSYEEILCAFGDAASHSSSMSAAIERLASYLTGNPFDGGPRVDDATRARVLSAFADTATREPQEGSCFISYSSEDSGFAERLRIDLERRGVRCWFAPHDLPIGAKIRPAIDKAIRENSRMILILSASSMASSWVEKEVETAFEREGATGTTILVPVRLDKAIMEAREGWAADIRRQRNIGDFTSWRDAPSYASALTRLLGSLRT